MRKVLIVDASEHWREVLERELGKTYRVCTCGDGLRARELADRFRPDLVIMDLMLPGVDGLGVIKALREQSEQLTVLLRDAVYAIDRMPAIESERKEP